MAFIKVFLHQDSLSIAIVIDNHTEWLKTCQLSVAQTQAGSEMEEALSRSGLVSAKQVV